MAFSDQEKKEFLEDLEYCVHQACVFHTFYQTGGDRLLEGYDHKQTVCNALLESSLTFLRKLNEFFSGSKRSISIRDYLPDEPVAYLFEGDDHLIVNDWVMHLSLKRVQDGTRNWEDFLNKYPRAALDRYEQFLCKLRGLHPEYFA